MTQYSLILTFESQTADFSSETGMLNFRLTKTEKKKSKIFENKKNSSTITFHKEFITLTQALGFNSFNLKKEINEENVDTLIEALLQEVRDCEDTHPNNVIFKLLLLTALNGLYIRFKTPGVRKTYQETTLLDSIPDSHLFPSDFFKVGKQFILVEVEPAITQFRKFVLSKKTKPHRRSEHANTNRITGATTSSVSGSTSSTSSDTAFSTDRIDEVLVTINRNRRSQKTDEAATTPQTIVSEKLSVIQALRATQTELLAEVKADSLGEDEYGIKEILARKEQFGSVSPTADCIDSDIVQLTQDNAKLTQIKQQLLEEYEKNKTLFNNLKQAITLSNEKRWSNISIKEIDTSHSFSSLNDLLTYAIPLKGWVAHYRREFDAIKQQAIALITSCHEAAFVTLTDLQSKVFVSEDETLTHSPLADTLQALKKHHETRAQIQQEWKPVTSNEQDPFVAEISYLSLQFDKIQTFRSELTGTEEHIVKPLKIRLLEEYSKTESQFKALLETAQPLTAFHQESLPSQTTLTDLDTHPLATVWQKTQAFIAAIKDLTAWTKEANLKRNALIENNNKIDFLLAYITPSNDTHALHFSELEEWVKEVSALKQASPVDQSLITIIEKKIKCFSSEIQSDFAQNTEGKNLHAILTSLIQDQNITIQSLKNEIGVWSIEKPSQQPDIAYWEAFQKWKNDFSSFEHKISQTNPSTIPCSYEEIKRRERALQTFQDELHRLKQNLNNEITEHSEPCLAHELFQKLKSQREREQLEREQLERERLERERLERERLEGIHSTSIASPPPIQTNASVLLTVIQNSTEAYLAHHGETGIGRKHGRRGVEKVKVLQQRAEAEIQPEEESTFIAGLSLLIDFYNDRLRNEKNSVMSGGTSSPHNHSYISFLANALKETSLLNAISDSAVPLTQGEDYISDNRGKHNELKQTRRELSRFFKNVDVEVVRAKLNLR